MINIDVDERQFQRLANQLGQLANNAVKPAMRRALPKIGERVLQLEKASGPRSETHRGPAKNPYKGHSDKWRAASTHAIDTITVSTVRTNKEDGSPYIIVGPLRGDNKPSFYLKFFEYGSKHMGLRGRPFIRPARDRVAADPVTADIVRAEINAELNTIKKG